MARLSCAALTAAGRGAAWRMSWPAERASRRDMVVDIEDGRNGQGVGSNREQARLPPAAWAPIEPPFSSPNHILRLTTYPENGLLYGGARERRRAQGHHF